MKYRLPLDMFLMPNPVQACDVQNFTCLVQMILEEQVSCLVASKPVWKVVAEQIGLDEDAKFCHLIEKGMEFYSAQNKKGLNRVLLQISSIAVRQQQAEQDRDCTPHGCAYARYTTDIMLHEWLRMLVTRYFGILMEGSQGDFFGEDYINYIKPFADKYWDKHLISLNCAAYDILSRQDLGEDRKHTEDFICYSWVMPFYYLWKGGEWNVA